MFKNYIQGTIRNFRKNKFYSIINILGLSLGITAATFILLYINDEISYDKHFKDYDKIYRLESDFTINDKHDKFALTAIPLAVAMKIEIPEIESFARFLTNENVLLKYNDKEFYEKRIFYADSTAPVMFSLDFIEGDPVESLRHPFTIILSETTAKKYFGDEPPFGKTIVSGAKRGFKVSGIFKDLPQNTHMQFDLLMSMESLATIVGQDQFRSLDPGGFWNVNSYSFIKLSNSEQIEAVHKQAPAVYNKYMKSLGDQVNASWDLMTTRIDKVHLTSNLTSDFPVGNKNYIYVMGIVGLMILMLAAINYTNLATARATKRAREIGLRKVSGANRSMLASQFITESIVLAIGALLISFALIQVLLPFFNDLASKQLSLNLIYNPGIYLLITVIAIFTGLVSGLYPAVYLSSFEPSTVLKGKIKLGREGTWLRKGLVTFQLTITVIMITGTILIYSQLSFMRNADLGFDKENVMVLRIQDTAFRNQRLVSFMDEIKTNPNIVATALSNGVPGDGGSIQVMKVEKEGKMQEYALNNTSVDYDFAELMGLTFVKGRNFSRDMGTDKKEAVIINEAAVKALGWTDNPIGKKIMVNFANTDANEAIDGEYSRVIGVVKDYNYRSLHNPIEPMVLYIPPFSLRQLSIRLKDGYAPNTIEFIKSKWESFGANRPFNYVWLDENFASVYDSEAKLGKVFYSFAVLSIFIALLGLLGLSSFITAQRTKEIGIRKVLGASTEGITGLLYKESLVLVLVACVIALPVSWYMLANWLDNFAYHVSLSWHTFAIASVTAVIVCLLSVSYHTIMAANSNPMISIKYE